MSLVNFFEYSSDVYYPSNPESSNWSYEIGLSRIYDEFSDSTKYPKAVVTRDTSAHTVTVGFGTRDEKIIFVPNYDNDRVYLYIDLLKKDGETSVRLASINNYGASITVCIEKLQNDGFILGLSTFREGDQYSFNYSRFEVAFIDCSDEITACVDANNVFYLESKYGEHQINLAINNNLRMNTSADRAVQLVKVYDETDNIFIDDIWLQNVGVNTNKIKAISSCKIGNKYYYLWNGTSTAYSGYAQVAVEFTDKVS